MKKRQKKLTHESAGQAQAAVDNVRDNWKEPARLTTSKTPQADAFRRIVETRRTLVPLGAQEIGEPVTAAAADQKIDLMNRTEITIRIERQFTDALLELLTEFAAAHPAAKLRAGTHG